MKNKNKKWTADEVSLLIRMRQNGKKNKEIAKRLGRTVASVSMRIAKLRQSGVRIARRNQSKGAPLDNQFRKGTATEKQTDKFIREVTLPKPKVDDRYHKSPKEVQEERGRLIPYKQQTKVVDTLVQCKDKLREALHKLSVLEEYSQQLERESKALIEALRAANKLIDVYTKRDED
tara:strand:- start:61 stop:588 length:528 start_codon:yes stop_codon:yes gene_type:complete